VPKDFDFSVNGRSVSVSLDSEETPLLDVLRNELGLVGTRFGCGLEQCGCCMVLIDGAPERSAAPSPYGALREKRSRLLRD
jgi:nicotinate dehydrogenase subunit A